jgi:type VI secretion system protein ImpK
LIHSFAEIFSYILKLRETQFQNAAYEQVLSRLREMVDRARAGALSFSSPHHFELALFAVCAWIDETILCSNWSGKDSWKHHLLQQEYFKTHRAGEEFYEKLDTLTANDSEVAEIYYYCFSLGFSGRYYHTHDHAILVEKMNKCFKKAVIGHNESMDENLGNKVLFPFGGAQGNVQNTDSDPKKQRMMKWALIGLPLFPTLVVGIVFYTVFQSTFMEYIRYLQG